MKGPVVYLDSSAIIKRYVEEPGSETVKELYRRTYAGGVKLSLSVWNIGEVLGALDRACSLKRISDEDYAKTRRRFLLEMKRLVKLKLVLLVLVKGTTLVQSWKILEKHHIYQADALQIASAKQVKADQFLTADVKLCKAASEEGLNSLCLTQPL